MSKPQDAFIAAGKLVKDAEQSQMFGKPCFKINGKAFTCFFEDCMVFKLGGKDHREAMDLNDSKLFDPSGAGRPMKEWVQVASEHEDQWGHLAKKAAKYVNG